MISIVMYVYLLVLEVFLEAPAPTLLPAEGQRAELYYTSVLAQYCDVHIQLALLSLDWIHWREGVAGCGLHKMRRTHMHGHRHTGCQQWE